MRSRGDKGQATVEFAGMLPGVLIVILVCFKVYTTMNTVEMVDNAARSGARQASIDHNLASCRTEALAALPAWLKEKANADDHLSNDPNNRVRVIATGANVGQISCRVEAKIPLLWEAAPLNITVGRTVHMPG